MYARLKLQLDTKEINFQQSSNLQGIIMENIDSQYASFLHGNQLNPYSQYIIKKDGASVWYIQTVTAEAYENIILPMAKLKEIEIKKKELHIRSGIGKGILRGEMSQISGSQLFDADRVQTGWKICGIPGFKACLWKPYAQIQ